MIISTWFPSLRTESSWKDVVFRTFRFFTQSFPVFTYPLAHVEQTFSFEQEPHFYGQFLTLEVEQELLFNVKPLGHAEHVVDVPAHSKHG